MNNTVFGKTVENMRKHRTISRRNYLVSEPSYHTTKFNTIFTENLLALINEKNSNTNE